MCIKNQTGAQRSTAASLPYALTDHVCSTPRRGFTLVEIMIVIVIVGLLATIAMPAFQRARMLTQNTRLANDLRQFSGAFESYSLEFGVWPADTNEGVLPPGMEGYITDGKFTERTVYGGNYDWEGPDAHPYAGVSIRSSNLEDLQAIGIDEILDNGDLGSGRFRSTGDSYVLIIEE